jgi:putative transposase
MTGNCHVRFGGRPRGKGPARQAPRRAADPTRTVRDQFLVEITAGIEDSGSAVGTLAQLNALFTAWVEQVYHCRVHTETGQAPLARFLAAGPPVPTPAAVLGEAFRWGEWRTVTSTATVSLHGNVYQVDPALAGARVELVFDPFDLSDIDVRHHGRPAGRAVPFRIGGHVHPKARAATPPPATPTGIDYLRLVEDRHTRALGERLRYAQLTDPPDPGPAHRPPPDTDGFGYHTDLLTLANADPDTNTTDPTAATADGLEPR